MMHNKTCSKCKEEKILSAFCKVIRNKDSLNSRCRECERILYNKNRESLLERSRIYRNNNKELLKENRKKISKKMSEYHKKRNANLTEAQRKIRRDKYRAWHNKRYHTDIYYKLKKRLINTFKYYFKFNNASKKFLAWQGCDMVDLKLWLESNFLPGMSWENYGNTPNCWSIDHIFPLSKLDLTSEEDCRRGFHYRNLQPMWHTDNLKKSNKII